MFLKNLSFKETISNFFSIVLGLPSKIERERSHVGTSYHSSYANGYNTKPYNRLDKSKPAAVQQLDWGVIWVVFVLALWGLVMVYSASIALPDNPKSKFANYSNYYFLIRHGISLVLSFTAAVLAFQISSSTWQTKASYLLIGIIVILTVILIPFIGKGAGGARRWIPLGIMNFQPSELAKLVILLYTADYMVRKMEIKEHFFRAVAPIMVAVGFIGLLLLLEPDMGAFMVISVIAMGILFLGGVNARMFLLMVLLMVFAFALIIVFSDWRRERIFAYLNPWDLKYALGKGFQLTHSLIAFGRGEILGVGLGESIEKLHWLPEAHTDFIFAVIGEEFGFIGVMLSIILFTILTYRIMNIGRQAISLDRLFPGLVAQGIAIWFGFQAFFNMGVNLGALPTKGLTLPFISYGGSALLICFFSVGIVLRIDYENKLTMRGIKP